MAVNQEGVLQQQPEAGQPKRPGNLASDAQAPMSNQAPASGAGAGQTASAELDFTQILQQQISQAIQPVLDEFRQQVTEAVHQQTAAAPAAPSDGQAGGQEAPPAPGSPPSVPAVPSAAPQAQAQAQPAQAPAQAAQGVGQAAPHALTEMLRPAVQAVERHGAQWLESMLVAGLAALLTEATHARVQQRAEQGLHILLQKVFEATPDGVANQEMLSKTEATLRVILREALDVAFAEGMRTAVQQGGQQVIRGSLHGDFGGALHGVEGTLKALVDALGAVLRRHQSTVLRLALALMLLAVESSLAQSDKDKADGSRQQAAQT